MRHWFVLPQGVVCPLSRVEIVNSYFSILMDYRGDGDRVSSFEQESYGIDLMRNRRRLKKNEIQ